MIATSKDKEASFTQNPYPYPTLINLGQANGKWSSHFHNIKTSDAAPRTGSDEPRRNPLSNAQIDKLVDERISLGVIEPSRSPWRFPVVLTPKSDGSMRFCVDYRRLNEVAAPDSYKLPRQDDIMDALGGSTIFSVLDLSHGFHQLPLDKASSPKLRFQHAADYISGLQFHLAFAMDPMRSNVY
jgi:hypothetical protein